MRVVAIHRFCHIALQAQGNEAAMLPPEWRLWPTRVVLCGYDENGAARFTPFKSVTVCHHDLLQLLPSKSLGTKHVFHCDT